MTLPTAKEGLSGLYVSGLLGATVAGTVWVLVVDFHRLDIELPNML